ncbi:hypothetical protein TB2_040817 [Malus domestica]
MGVTLTCSAIGRSISTGRGSVHFPLNLQKHS